MNKLFALDEWLGMPSMKPIGDIGGNLGDVLASAGDNASIDLLIGSLDFSGLEEDPVIESEPEDNDASLKRKLDDRAVDTNSMKPIGAGEMVTHMNDLTPSLRAF